MSNYALNYALILPKKSLLQVFYAHFLLKKRRQKRKKIIAYTKSSHFIQNFMPQYSSCLSTFIKNT